MMNNHTLNQWDSGVYERAFSITPNNGADIRKTRALYIGGTGGNVRVNINDQDITFTGLAAGTVLPIAVTRVYATSTTATGIIGLY